MIEGKRKFKNGLEIVYVYPDKEHPNIDSLIQLHFKFNGTYKKRNEATFSEAIAAINGIKEDTSELQEWIKIKGLPKFFLAITETQLLVRIIKESGLITKKYFEGDDYSFRIETTGMTEQEIFKKMNKGIDSIQQYAQYLEGRRNRAIEK